jgi:nicotinamidase-related amidase
VVSGFIRQSSDISPGNARLLSGHAQHVTDLEIILYKPRWGAFYQTALEEQLRRWSIGTTVFTGCNFPNCPRASIVEASERDFRVAVVADAVSGRTSAESARWPASASPCSQQTNSSPH